MDDIQKKRPTAVTVIGWIFITNAILMILTGGMGFMAFSFIHRMAGDIPAFPAKFSQHMRVMQIIFQHFGILALSQIAFAIFMLIASIEFLKLRAWARNALEIISWIGLVYVVGFGIFWVTALLDVTSSMHVAEGSHNVQSLFGIFGAVMGALVMAVWAVPLIIIIYFLHKKTLRETFAKSSIMGRTNG
jgi:hypothetical protein